MCLSYIGILQLHYFHLSVFLKQQVDKVVQMYETMMTRHTTMIVGPTGGGKSVVINTLCQAQTKYVDSGDEPRALQTSAKLKDGWCKVIKKSCQLFHLRTFS